MSSSSLCLNKSGCCSLFSSLSSCLSDSNLNSGRKWISLFLISLSLCSPFHFIHSRQYKSRWKINGNENRLCNNPVFVCSTKKSNEKNRQVDNLICLFNKKWWSKRIELWTKLVDSRLIKAFLLFYILKLAISATTKSVETFFLLKMWRTDDFWSQNGVFSLTNNLRPIVGQGLAYPQRCDRKAWKWRPKLTFERGQGSSILTQNRMIREQIFSDHSRKTESTRMILVCQSWYHLIALFGQWLEGVWAKMHIPNI